jgi:hypothetical protein
LDSLYSKADDRAKSVKGRVQGAKLVGTPGLPGGSLDLKQAGQDFFQNLGGIDRLYGVSPADYINSVPEADINYQRTASPDDLARMQALTELAGLDQTYLDPNLVGTMDDEPLTSFDLNRFISNVNQRKGELEGYLRDAPASLGQGYGNISGGLESVLNQGRQTYDDKLNAFNQYSAEQRRPGYGGNADYLRNTYIEPYEQLVDQAENLRRNYGYYDLVRR